MTENVIFALAEGRFVPFRTSPLTYSLQNPLSDKSTIGFITTVPEKYSSVQDIIMTLRTSLKAMQIKEKVDNNKTNKI